MNKLIIRRIDGKRSDCVRIDLHSVVLTAVYLEFQMREELKQWDISFHDGYLLVDHKHAETLLAWMRDKGLQ